MMAAGTTKLSFSDRLAIFIATGFYISLVPAWLLHKFKHTKNSQDLSEKKLTGAGLLGSLQGAATYYFLPAHLADAWWMIVLGIIFAVLVSAKAERALKSHDDARIVIDEWIGAWIALWGVGQYVGFTFVLAVLAFRFFDVFKGFIGRRLQNLPGGWGVSMDDVYAGIAANLCWRLSVELLKIPH